MLPDCGLTVSSPRASQHQSSAHLEGLQKSGIVRAMRATPESPMRLKFYTLDVFTEQRFGGNPLVVVLDAEGLDTRQMQMVAREFNLSETVFALKSDKVTHSARVRIFTPRGELPFAGHPTIGTASLLAELHTPAVNGERDAIIVLEEQIGTVRVGVRLRASQAAYAEFDAPRLPEEVPGVLDKDAIASALGIIPSAIGFENHRPTRFSAGLPFTFVPVSDTDTLEDIDISHRDWSEAFADNAAYVYCRQTRHAAAHFHARMFDPGHGIAEDPATGSAAAALAGVVHRFDRLTDGLHRRIIEQGYEMGRPSSITLSLDIVKGQLGTVRIGGASVRVGEGSLEI
jgi:trans-2,3-dihydro-3-hydroxyanthranilate isomerase